MAIQIGGKDIVGLVVGTSSGNKDVVEVWQGSATGNKLVWQSIFIPEGYVLATDDDFTYNGTYYSYKGNKDKILIPNKWNGQPMDTYNSLFSNVSNSPTGVATSPDHPSTNMDFMFVNFFGISGLDLQYLETGNVVSMKGMFQSSTILPLDLSNFNTTNVVDMSGMFAFSYSKLLDLSSFDMSNVVNTDNMFAGSAATVGYARTQVDADKFNASSGKPAKLTFVVK